MTPLKVFMGLYLVTFAATVVVSFTAVKFVRWPMTLLGVLLAVYGGCLTTNLLGFTDEVASKARRSTWTPPAMASPSLLRAVGVFFLLGGIGFAAQALLVDNR